MTPQGLPDDEYLLCSQKIFQSFNQVTSSVDSIRSLPGNNNCPEMTMETFSASEESSDFVCSTNAMAVILNSSTHICRNVICCISHYVYINKALYLIWYMSDSQCFRLYCHSQKSLFCNIFMSVCFPMNDVYDVYVY